MLQEEKVSIIIPVYNAERYLQRCIDSLTAQTYRNIELIFVDDGSRDGSADIIKSASKRDSRIQILSQNNSGPSAARNRGMDCATGRYLMFCDSDDTVSTTWCEKHVNTIRAYPDAWIVSGIQTMGEDGSLLAFTKFVPGSGIFDKAAYFELFRCGYSGSVDNKIFDLTRVRSEGIRFDESRRRGEDVIFAVAYFMKTANIVVIDELLYQYYRYDTSETLTNRYHEDDYKVLCDTYRWRKRIITPDHMEAFQVYYWDKFLKELENTMQLNRSSFRERIRINEDIVGTDVFQELLICCGEKSMNKAAIYFLSSRKYIGYYFIQLLHAVREKCQCIFGR